MTQLRKLMLEELQRRNYFEGSAKIYIRTVKELTEYFACSPAKLGLEQIRQYQVHLAKKKVAPRTIEQRTAALRFFFVKSLRRPYLPENIPFPKTPRRLPRC